MKDDKRYALFSVWDKTGSAELAKVLHDAGYTILSSSGTAKHIESAGVPVVKTEDLTGLPSILGGRVKTLHPGIMGGILARRGNAGDDSDRAAHDIPLIDIVVCSLYPFEETVRSGGTLDEIVEKIDIGGVSLIRAAAKNYKYVTVVTDMRDYDRVAKEVSSGGITDATRRELALKAFAATASYDATIEIGLSAALGAGAASDEMTIPLRRVQTLRYGENPYQHASLYLPTLDDPAFIVHSGKELSYNNLLDVDGLLKGRRIFAGREACVIVKHTTPCGTAEGASALDAYERALACDPVSAFGGIVGFTGRVDLATAKKLCEHFFEIVAADAYDEDALEYLKGHKKNLRVLTFTGNYAPKLQITACMAGFLAQEDVPPPMPTQEAGRWVGKPRPDLWNDLIFAWRTVSITKSNAIVLAKTGASVGIGGGFTNRVDAAEYAIRRAGDASKGAVLASDAFFPFPDTVELAANAGVSAIIQPGGSIKDKEVEQAALDLGLSMFIGGTRTFRH